MKESPQSKKLDEMLRSSKLAAGGFMGYDSRNVYEIIDNDLAIISEFGYTKEQIAARMQEITQKAIPLLGNWEEIDEKLLARVDEAKGSLVCPWPHSGRYAKRVTYVKSIKTDETIQWSDLNIHFIEEHGFFEGKGANFRIKPQELIKIIF